MFMCSTDFDWASVALKRLSLRDANSPQKSCFAWSVGRHVQNAFRLKACALSHQHMRPSTLDSRNPFVSAGHDSSNLIQVLITLKAQVSHKTPCTGIPCFIVSFYCTSHVATSTNCRQELLPTTRLWLALWWYLLLGGWSGTEPRIFYRCPYRCWGLFPSFQSLEPRQVSLWR